MKQEYDITLTGGFKEAQRRPKKRKKSLDLTWYYLGLVGQIGYVVALPIAGGAILGSIVGSTLVGISVGFVLSVFGFIRIIQRIVEIKK